MKKGNDVEACMLVVQRCLAAAAAAAVHRSRWRASGRWCPLPPFTPFTHQPWLSCIHMIKLGILARYAAPVEYERLHFVELL